MAETKSTSVRQRKVFSYGHVLHIRRGCRGAGVQHVFGGFDSTKSHPTDKDVSTLLIFTGQLVFKLVCYIISIKPYIMIGFTTRKKTNYPYASQTPIIVQHKQ